MKRVKGNANGQKNIEMRWLVDDTDAREQPLKILEQKVPIFEEPEHAQVHADAANQPDASRTASFSRGNSSAEPKIHCRRGKEQRGKWWGSMRHKKRNLRPRGNISARSRNACSSTRLQQLQ